jgi:TRAP-type C4-dicarboxylate transport system permease small subunit
VRSPLALLDAGLEAVDVWSNRVSIALFRVAVDFALPALMVVVTLDVVLRYVFNSPLPWGRDVNGVLLLMLTFSALPHAWDRGYHIRMEVFYNRLHGRARDLADVATGAAGILFFALMGAQALLFTPYMLRTGETGEDLLLPIWPFMAYMGFCSLVLAARLLGNPSGEEQVGIGSEAAGTNVIEAEAHGTDILEAGPNDGTVPDGTRPDGGAR